MAAKSRKPKSAVEMAAAQREISVSEFFVKNRHLLGFDNPLKALLTTVKEGVDNALDACEEAGIPPDVTVAITRVADAGSALPTPAAEAVCGFTGEVVAAEGGNGHSGGAQDAASADGVFQRTLFDDDRDQSEEEENARAAASADRGRRKGGGVSSPPERFVVAIEDNGPGILEAQIGKVFGKLLYGSKFHRLRQSLTADQPVLVERNGRVEWVPIGDLVDGFLTGEQEVADVTGCGLRAPAFDPETLRYEWREVSHVIRHPRANEVLEVRTEGRRSVRVTGCHSLFSYDAGSGRVRDVEARSLRPGDYVVAPKRLPAPASRASINLLEEMDAADVESRGIYVYGVPGETSARLESVATVASRADAQGRSRRFLALPTPDDRGVDVLEDSWRQYPTGKIDELLRQIDNVQAFVASDLCLVRVESVREVADENRWVYDLSVPGCENFVAGTGALACHNSRGQQGIGISAAGMYGQLTTGKPVRILSKVARRKAAHFMEVILDVQKNQPDVRCAEDRPWDKAHGTRVEIELEAKYQKGQRSVDAYLRATALANPHVTIRYCDPDGQWTVYERATEKLPDEPREVQPHPYGVELGMLLQMLKVTQEKKLGPFLEKEFSRVSRKTAGEICDVAGLNPSTWVARVAREEASALHQALSKVKVMNPPVDCISPIGEGLLVDSLNREYPKAFLRAVTRSPSVYRGNPFQVEVALAYGEGIPGDGPASVLRFANRVPLLYQQGACAITKAVMSVPWRNYGVDQSRGALPSGPLVLVVHLASVWVPFTSESKEAVAHYPEILKEIRLAVMECGRTLGIHLRRRKREADALKKRDYIARYIPKISEALQGILEFDQAEREKTTQRLVEILNRSRNL